MEKIRLTLEASFLGTKEEEEQSADAEGQPQGAGEGQGGVGAGQVVLPGVGSLN